MDSFDMVSQCHVPVVGNMRPLIEAYRPLTGIDRHRQYALSLRLLSNMPSRSSNAAIGETPVTYQVRLVSSLHYSIVRFGGEICRCLGWPFRSHSPLSKRPIANEVLVLPALPRLYYSISGSGSLTWSQTSSSTAAIIVLQN
jgi:hypothetical protein